MRLFLGIMVPWAKSSPDHNDSVNILMLIIMFTMFAVLVQSVIVLTFAD